MMKWSAYQAFSLVAFFFSLLLTCLQSCLQQKFRKKKKKKEIDKWGGGRITKLLVPTLI